MFRNMWNSVFIVLVAVGGSWALGRAFSRAFRDCGTEMCDGLAIPKSKGEVPNEEELKLMCSSGLKERFECRKSAIQNCTGKSAEELSSSNNISVADGWSSLLNMQNLSGELCDEDSVLHEGYVSSVDCFNNLFKVKRSRRCPPPDRAVRLAVYQSEEYRILEMAKTEFEEPTFLDDCLYRAFSVVCLTIDLREQCGDTARATLVEMLQRVQFLTQAGGFCEKGQMEILRTAYLEHTEDEEEKKTEISQLFKSL